jgi:hypothetical protein
VFCAIVFTYDEIAWAKYGASNTLPVIPWQVSRLVLAVIVVFLFGYFALSILSVIWFRDDKDIVKLSLKFTSILLLQSIALVVNAIAKHVYIFEP